MYNKICLFIKYNFGQYSLSVYTNVIIITIITSIQYLDSLESTIYEYIFFIIVIESVSVIL